MTEEKALEQQIIDLQKQLIELQEQFDYLNRGGIKVSPQRRLEKIRRECRDKYFGTWEEMRAGKTQYGPSGKTRSDYDVIEEIVMKESGLLYKYSCGRTAKHAVITGLVRTQDDEIWYREICERVCEDLMKQIMECNGRRTEQCSDRRR